MKITAIIVTFNRPDALEIIFRSLMRQRLMPDEVIIADDGSDPETALIIKSYRKHLPAEMKYVWHENKGFRAATIRNKAILSSTGDYLVFSDGDLVFHPHFFYDFRQRIERKTVLIGSRVFLTPGASEKILSAKRFPDITPLISRHIGKNRLNSVRAPFVNRLLPPVQYSGQLRGGLLGVWKPDLQAVNGWNESFTGWGMEDTELVARLYYSGIMLRKLKFAGIAYHLWHPVMSRDHLAVNRELLRKSVMEKLTWCENGLVKGSKI